MAKKKTKKKNLARNRLSVTTQQYLDISEIKENTVIMRDGSLRGILLVSSINFALKSEEEQNAIIAAYVGFLNNLTFPLQILVQSRELSIDNYLKELKQKEKEQTNEQLKIQMSGYRQYIEELVSLGQIMNKRFYVVVPFYPLSDKHKGFWTSLKEAIKPVSLIKMKEEMFKRYKNYLDLRIEGVVGGLASLGLHSTQLDTQSLIELFYNTYNPATSKNQKLVDIKSLRVSQEE